MGSSEPGIAVPSREPRKKKTALKGATVHHLPDGVGADKTSRFLANAVPVRRSEGSSELMLLENGIGMYVSTFRMLVI